MTTPRDGIRGGATMLLCLCLAGCGSSTSSSTATPIPTPAATPQAVHRSIIGQTGFSGFRTGLWVRVDVVLSDRGQVDITIDWTSDETWMFAYLSGTDCSFAQLDRRTCPFLIESETKEPRPRILVSETLEPGVYRLYLYNVPRDPETGIGSDVTEAVSIQIGLTVPVT